MTSTPLLPQSLRLDQFTYDLPAHFIAVHPLPERDQSRLLVYRRPENSISHQQFTDLPELVPVGSLLVVNRTRVIAARLNMMKPTGGAVEVLLTDPMSPIRDPAVVLASLERSVWRPTSRSP